MAYGDVKQNFPKGTLNSYWYYIELCRLLFPDEDGTQIDKLQEALIRYSLISPWPLPDKVLSWACILTSRMMQSSTWKGR